MCRDTDCLRLESREAGWKTVLLAQMDVMTAWARVGGTKEGVRSWPISKAQLTSVGDHLEAGGEGDREED